MHGPTNVKSINFFGEKRASQYKRYNSARKSNNKISISGSWLLENKYKASKIRQRSWYTWQILHIIKFTILHHFLSRCS